MILFVSSLLSTNSNREERGETYDLICLSDMKFDNQRIKEIEDPCLPQDIHGWISMNVLKMKEELDQATKGNEVLIKYYITC